MSLHAWRHAQVLHVEDVPFDALIMAAIWRADSTNAALLTAAFPAIAAETQARYDAPGGLLEGEHA